MVDDVIACLEHDGKNAVNWFKINGMQANPEKFQLMILSSGAACNRSIVLDDVIIQSEQNVKCLGVTIDSRLNFSLHISNCCRKAARQLNALARISKYLDPASRKVIYNSFVISNFTYCPLVWHFCGKKNNNKIEKIQERALRILYKDNVSTYGELTDKADSSTMLISRLKVLALETFKSMQEINTPAMNDLFTQNDVPYSMRNSMKAIQRKRKTATYGLRSISYLGPKIWNELLSKNSDIANMDLQCFKTFIRTWQGPSCLDTGHYV